VRSDATKSVNTKIYNNAVKTKRILAQYCAPVLAAASLNAKNAALDEKISLFPEAHGELKGLGSRKPTVP
jgi:hypothetical protein